MRSPTAVLSRQGQSGHYRGQLNFMYQNEVITKPDIEEIEDRNESGGVAGYTGIVRFEIVATGEKKVFIGNGPSKSAAYEDAAQTAVNKICEQTMSTDCHWCCVLVACFNIDFVNLHDYNSFLCCTVVVMSTATQHEGGSNYHSGILL